MYRSMGDKGSVASRAGVGAGIHGGVVRESAAMVPVEFSLRASAS
jgi:hypothetical protein